MSVFRVEKTKGYTVMSNHHLRNHALSLKAKGLLSQMLSLPDDWGITRCRGLRRSTKRASTPSAKLCASWNVPVTSSAAGSVTSVAACAEPSTRSTSSRTRIRCGERILVQMAQHPAIGFAEPCVHGRLEEIV